MVYTSAVIEIRETEVFSKWLGALRDVQARVRVQARLLRLRQGNAGDVRAVGAGVSELRSNYGPGYRVYDVKRGEALVILLAGGAKPTQDDDIRTALKLARLC